MKTNKPYELFIEALKSRFPQKKKMASTLMEILHMERESVYRRLRGDVLFSFTEMAILAEEFHISLDSMLEGGRAGDKSSPCMMTHVDYFKNPTDTDYKMTEGIVDFLKVVITMPYSESGTATNTIPAFFYIQHPFLLKFHLLKWAFQNHQLIDKRKLEEINIPDRFREIYDGWQLFEEIQQTIFIWDKSVFQTFVNDVNYFRDIRRITQEDVLLLKEDAHKLLNQLEFIAKNGKFPSGKPVQFYVSQLKLDTTHTYIYADKYTHLSLMKGFTVTDIFSMDIKVTERMRVWLESLKRTSTCISQTAEVHCLRFFERQREIVDTLI